LQQDGTAIRQSAQDRRLSAGRHGDIVDGVLALTQGLKAVRNLSNPKITRELARHSVIDVIDRGHLHTKFGIRRQVRRARNATCADQTHRQRR